MRISRSLIRFANLAFLGPAACLPASAQVYQEPAPGFVSLQNLSPGRVQAGNINIGGSAIFGDSVGIGTSAPSALLDVNGIARMLGFELPTGAVDGYVLTSDASGNATWQPNAGITLPFIGAYPAEEGVLEITNTGGSNGYAIRGHSDTELMGTGIGVYGTAVSGFGVWGESSATTGFTTGVWGQTRSNDGVAVYGFATASGDAVGIYGLAPGDGGIGVYGEGRRSGLYGRGIGRSYGVTGVIDQGTTFLPGAVYGQYGAGGGGNALFGFGNMAVTGTKTFSIDHPLDPENKILLHYCAEGPEPINAYRGTVRTNAKGYAIVTLPEYYEAINVDPTVQLTVVDSGEDFVLAKVVSRPKNGRFTIRTSRGGTEVDWRVEARRNDRHVRQNGAPPEIDKGELRGKYLVPALYGKPMSDSMSATLDPRLAGKSAPARPVRP